MSAFASVLKRYGAFGAATLLLGTVSLSRAQAQSRLAPTSDQPTAQAAEKIKSFTALPQGAHPLALAANRVALRAADAPIQITVALRLSDEKGLDALLAEIQRPGSPQYHHFLTPQQFADRFGPTQADYDLVKAHLIASGLKINGTTENRLAISAQGTTAQAQKAFQVAIAEYRTAAKSYFANETAPALPARIAPLVQHVFGLDDYPVPLLHAKKNPGGSGYTPQQIQTAYNISPIYAAGYTGKGVTLAIVSLYSYDPASALAYAHDYVSPNFTPTITTINVDGGPGPYASQGSGTLEANLDIDMALATAYNANILFYQGNYKNSLQELYSVTAKVVSDNKADIVTTSYGFGEKYWSTQLATATTAYHNVLQSAAAQGMTSYISSGDEGTTGRDISGNSLIHDPLTASYPGSDPNIISVGGTTLFVDANNQITEEDGWSSAYQAGGASGGGVSQLWTAPSWQAFTKLAKRAFPDVALNADGYSGYLVYDPSATGGAATVGGTSASSPMWAAATAVIWEYAHSLGYSLRQGNVAPAYYTLGATAAFHDITIGNNQYIDAATNQSYQYYNCVTGYDLATGWGSANFTTLAIELFPTLSTLTVTPSPVTGGKSATGTVTLNYPLGVTAVINLSSSNPDVASVPASVTIAAGSTTATFTVSTTAVSASQNVTLSAAYGSVTKTAALTVNSANAPLVTLTGLTLAPTSVSGGKQNSTGTVTLSNPAPTGGATISLSSSDATAATVPTNVTVSAGATSATFTATSKTVTTTKTPVITAAYNGVSKTATLTVTAAPTGATITGHLYNDRNGDGIQEAGEPALSGWTVYLDLNNNGQRDAGEPIATTDATGAYSFSGLTARTYYIYGYNVPAGWRSTEPSYPYDGYSVVVQTNGTAVVDFGYSQTALLTGTLYNDLDASGTQDPGETGLSGWTVYLDTNNNGRYDAGEPTTTTDADGVYSFAVTPGLYYIRVIAKAGWSQDQPVGYDGYYATVTNAQVVTGLDFGYDTNDSTAALSGSVKFEGISAMAPDQPVTFTLVPVGGGTPYILTEAIPVSGAFTLNNIPVGAYQIHIKGTKWLAVNALNIDLNNGDYSGINVLLPAGDANNDNFCDTTDFGVLVGAYGADGSIVGSGYDATADFNCDGFVDTTDFGLLVGNYGRQGDPLPKR